MNAQRLNLDREFSRRRLPISAPTDSDRDVAERLLRLLGIMPDTHRTGSGELLRDRPDAYVIEYALASASNKTRADNAERADATHFIASARANARASRQRALDASRAPLPNSREAALTDEERALPPWKQPLPNSRNR